MINPFSWADYAPTDQSIYYLYNLFGSVNGLLCNTNVSSRCLDSSGTVNLGGVGLQLFGAMFQAFNTVILAIGALIIVYVTVVGVLKTAQEGEFMGRHWNSLWIPVRMVLGIGMLVPTASGYSGIQIIIMWVIIQGIGAADFMWNTSLGAIKILGSPYGKVTIPTAQIDQNLHTVFQSLVCEETAIRKSTNPIMPPGIMPPVDLPGSYYCTPTVTNPAPNPTFCGGDLPTNYGDNPKTINFAGGLCGSVNLCDKDAVCTSGKEQSIKCAACTQQISAMNDIIGLLRPIAHSFAEADYWYRDFYYNSGNPAYSKPKPEWGWIINYCQTQNPPVTPCLVKDVNSTSFPSPNASTTDAQGPTAEAVKFYWTNYPGLEPTLKEAGNAAFLDVSVNKYASILQTAVDELLKEIQKNASEGGNILSGISNTNGWIMAGSYYFKLAQTNQNNLKDAVPNLNAKPMDVKGAMVNFRNNFSASNYLSDTSSGEAASNPISGSDVAPVGQVSNSAAKSISNLAQQFSKVSSGQDAQGKEAQNPLAAISTIGITMIATAQAIFMVFIGVTIGLSVLGYLNIFVLGSGFDNPMGPTLTTTYLLIVPALFGLLAWLITMGGILGIYIPLIPYVIFTVGAIGWLISTIEAMIAGPLVALGVMSPSGQHEVMGKAEPALMLLFNIFLRPTLMIFGMMAAMVLAPIVVIMINAGFWGVVDQISPGWYLPINLLGIILWISAYVLFILAALNKTFAVIHIIPERVMRWISGQAGESYGEGEVLGEQKRGVESASGSAAGAVGKVRESEGAEAKGIEAAKAHEGKRDSGLQVSGDDK